MDLKNDNNRLPQKENNNNWSVGWPPGWLTASLTASPFASVLQCSRRVARAPMLVVPWCCYLAAKQTYWIGRLGGQLAGLLPLLLLHLLLRSGNALDVLSGRAGPRPICLSGALAEWLDGWLAK